MLKKEIDNKQDQLNKMYRDFEAEKVMLTDELRKKRLRREQLIRRSIAAAA